MKYARVINNTVVEVFEPADGFRIDECFAPAVAAQFIPCPQDVEQNWITEGELFRLPDPAPAIEFPPLEEEA